MSKQAGVRKNDNFFQQQLKPVSEFLSAFKWEVFLLEPISRVPLR